MTFSIEVSPELLERGITIYVYGTNRTASVLVGGMIAYAIDPNLVVISIRDPMERASKFRKTMRELSPPDRTFVSYRPADFGPNPEGDRVNPASVVLPGDSSPAANTLVDFLTLPTKLQEIWSRFDLGRSHRVLAIHNVDLLRPFYPQEGIAERMNELFHQQGVTLVMSSGSTPTQRNMPFDVALRVKVPRDFEQVLGGEMIVEKGFDEGLFTRGLTRPLADIEFLRTAHESIRRWMSTPAQSP